MAGPCFIAYQEWSITETIEGKERDVEPENPTTGQTRKKIVK
jgi:hypothetical protein